jgi:hypothetical protein
MTSAAAHSKLGASSMYRWSACPGSVRASEGIESKSSSYAEEGTAAHALAEHCLRHGYGTGRFAKDPNSPAEMRDAVQVYLDAVRGAITCPDDVLHIEQRFDLSAVYPGCFGTADAVVWQPRTRTLIVFDYKHGAGIPVKVGGNPQLDYYALGALLSLGYPAKTVRKVIVQPRCEHPDGPVRSVETTPFELLEFRADLVAYARATEAPDAPLVPGDHCRFCPAAAVNCSALRSKAQAVAKTEFAPQLPYDPEQLSLALESIPALEAWVKNVREFAYAEAEAGRCPPRHKIVQKRSTRRWRDEGEVVDALQQTHSDIADFFEPRALLSPAQLEKKVGKEFVAQYTSAESSGHVLVPDSDRRPAVKVSAKEDFAATA